jgi:hypothetical protein
MAISSMPPERQHSPPFLLNHIAPTRPVPRRPSSSPFRSHLTRSPSGSAFLPAGSSASPLPADMTFSRHAVARSCRYAFLSPRPDVLPSATQRSDIGTLRRRSRQFPSPAACTGAFRILPPGPEPSGSCRLDRSLPDPAAWTGAFRSLPPGPEPSGACRLDLSLPAPAAWT